MPALTVVIMVLLEWIAKFLLICALVAAVVHTGVIVEARGRESGAKFTPPTREERAVMAREAYDEAARQLGPKPGDKLQWHRVNRIEPGDAGRNYIVTPDGKSISLNPEPIPPAIVTTAGKPWSLWVVTWPGHETDGLVVARRVP